MWSYRIRTRPKLFLSFSVWPLQSSQCKCRRLLLHFITLGRISLDEWSALRRDLYLATQHSHKRETSTLPAGFEPAIPVSKRLQTHALDRADTSSYLPDYYHQHLIKEDDMGGACITHTVWVRNAYKLGGGTLGDKDTHRRTIWQWSKYIVEFNMWLLWTQYCNLQVYKIPEMMAVLRTTRFPRMT